MVKKVKLVNKKRKVSEPANVLEISQSNIKLVEKYQAGLECGHVVSALLSGAIKSIPSAAMKLGTYFEYVLFGTPDRDGTIPQPELMASGKKKIEVAAKLNHQLLVAGKKETQKPDIKVEDMTIDYRRAHATADRVKKYLKKMGIKVKHTNVRVSTDGMTGLLDTIMEGRILGGEATVDCKYSGLLDDPWSQMGWSFEKDFQVEHHGTQAKHYHLLKGLPFFYLVVESKSDYADIRFFKAEFTEQGLNEHRELVSSTRSIIEINNVLGWEPKPEFKRCESCQLRENCNDRSWHPEIKTIQF